MNLSVIQIRIDFHRRPSPEKEANAPGGSCQCAFMYEKLILILRKSLEPNSLDCEQGLSM